MDGWDWEAELRKALIFRILLNCESVNIVKKDTSDSVSLLSLTEGWKEIMQAGSGLCPSVSLSSLKTEQYRIKLAWEEKLTKERSAQKWTRSNSRL